MRVKEVIKAAKANIDLGDWKAGDIPPGEFRLRREQKTQKQGKGYRWCVITFDSLGLSFRVLVNYSVQRMVFRATLGMEDAGVVRIVCVREFHQQLPGWHCHADPQCNRRVSVWNHKDLQRYPKTHVPNRPFGVTSDEQARQAALRFYRIELPFALEPTPP